MRIFSGVMVLFIILFSSYNLSYGIENRRDVQIPPPGQGAPPQPPKSALPTVPSSGIPGAPPVHSPGITTPSAQPAFVPSVDANIGMGAQQVPIVNNLNGKVIDINKSAEKWVMVRDALFGVDVKIKIKNLESTPIIKGNRILSFNDINAGDMLNIIYTSDANAAFSLQGDENNIASAIQVLTEEDMQMRGLNEEGLITGFDDSAEKGNMPSVQLQQNGGAVKTPEPVKNEPEKADEPVKEQGFFDRFLDGFKNK